MPNTAKTLKTTVDKLAKMSNVEQLDYVFKYYNYWKKLGAKYDEPYKLFLTAFYPAALIKNWIADRNYIFGSEKSMSFAKKVGSQNKGFDIDGDGYISVKDYINYHNRLFQRYGISIPQNTISTSLLLLDPLRENCMRFR